MMTGQSTKSKIEYKNVQPTSVKLAIHQGWTVESYPIDLAHHRHRTARQISSWTVLQLNFVLGRIDHTVLGRIVQTSMGRICSGANSPDTPPHPTSPHCQFRYTNIHTTNLTEQYSQKNYKNRRLLLLLNFTPRHDSLCDRKCVKSARVSDRKNRDFLASNPEQNLLSQICRFGSISYEVIDK
jgi:hypothetical protein